MDKHRRRILSVDVTIMNGQENLHLTGQLGNVMKESAQAALSYLELQKQKELGINPISLKEKRFIFIFPKAQFLKMDLLQELQWQWRCFLQ
jgi:ATP-dependent Lon protease